MTSYISPGVYSVENDLSAYVSNLSATIVGMVGTSPIGPTNTPTLITTPNDFVTTFGNLDPNHYLGYAALSYLSQGNSLWVTRVAGAGASFAKAAFPLPTGYTPYTGNWTLSAQSASTVTLALTNDDNKMVILPSTGEGSVVPKFNIVDATQSLASTGQVGADIASFYQNPSLIEGGLFKINLGPGKGVNAPISSLAGSAATPKVVLPVSAFPTTNCPSTSYAVGSIAIPAATIGTTIAAETSLITLGVDTNGHDITLSTPPATGWTASSLDPTSASYLANVGDYIVATGTGTATTFTIYWPLNVSTSATVATSLTVLQNILNGLLAVVNSGTVTISSASATAFRTYASYDVSGTGTAFGVGSVNASTGIAQGFSATSVTTNSSNTVTSVLITSLLKGFLGMGYSFGTNASLTIVNPTISGTFTTNFYRPSWNLVSAGTSWVPTIIKIFSLGETDSSNISVSLNMVNGNLSSTGEQLYTLWVFQRIVSTSISITSSKLADFQLAESYTGTIDAIQSSILAKSQLISMKIDYTTYDLVEYGTGTVQAGVSNTDNLVMDFVLRDSTLSSGVCNGTIPVANINQFEIFLEGGNAGNSVTNYDIIGSSADNTGLYSFANPETIDINVLIAPGWSADPAVGKAITSICTSRGDAIGVLDTPFGLNVQNVIKYRNDIQDINSSYSALYYPWVQIADTVNKKNVFVPPSGLVVSQYAYNDKVSDVFFAPAGINRGTITSALATERLFSQGDRDQLAMNNVNPIVSEPGYGIYIKGQMTLQTQTTALNRVNVRRLLLKLRKVIATASKVFEFQPGDSTTAYQLQQIAQTILSQNQKAGGIQSYKIDVGSDVNTPLTLSNNQLNMVISIVPTLTAEVIIETYNILPQGGLNVTSTLS